MVIPIFFFQHVLIVFALWSKFWECAHTNTKKKLLYGTEVWLSRLPVPEPPGPRAPCPRRHSSASLSRYQSAAPSPAPSGPAP